MDNLYYFHYILESVDSSFLKLDKYWNCIQIWSIQDYMRR